MRPYKQAWPVERALAFLRESSGTHFDPVLVTAFEKVMADILDLRALCAAGADHDMDEYRARYDAALKIAGGKPA